MTVKRIIDSKCIGYSVDFKYTYFQHTAKTVTGKMKTVYSYSCINAGGGTLSGPFTKVKPFVTRDTNGELMTA